MHTDAGESKGRGGGSAGMLRAGAFFAVAAAADHTGTCPTNGKCPASAGDDKGLPCCQWSATEYDCCYSGESCITNVGCRCPADAGAACHDRTRARVAAHINRMPGVAWKAGVVERFRGTPIGASKPLLGVKPDNAEVMAEAVRRGAVHEVDAAVGLAVPDSFDSITAFPQCAKVIGDIRDQSNCGCCWAFGGAEAASDRLCISTNATTMLPLSAQQLCFCSNTNGCGGGYLNAAWEYIKSTGLVTGAQQQPDDGKTDPFAGMGLCSSFSLPHCHHHGPTAGDPYPAEGAKGCPSESSPKCPTACDAGAKSPHADFAGDKYTFGGKVETYTSVASMQQALMSGGPIEVAFTVYDDFENYASGVYHKTSNKQLGGHAVKLVGWGTDGGEDYWKVANSWNPYWGEKGYFRIRRGTNECGIESQSAANGAGSWCHVEATSCSGAKPGDCCSKCAGSGTCMGTCTGSGECCPMGQACGDTCCASGTTCCGSQCCSGMNKCCGNKKDPSKSTCQKQITDTCCPSGGSCSNLDTCCGSSCCKFMKEKCVSGKCTKSDDIPDFMLP